MTVLPLDRPPSARRGRQRRPGSPTPIQRGLSFADLGVPAPVVTALAEVGITAPFPIQAATLTDTLAGRDVLGRGQTGSGKTLAFCIPLVA
ncbi:MAG: DEAD/DEAH box helicase, partial [Streptosporangiaceae bacterium]